MIRQYFIDESVHDFIISESQNKYPKETGGILVGRLVEDRAKITNSIGPGPNALHKRNKFKRDGDFSQDILDSYVDQSNGEYDYIGEWHSHPQNNGPSSKDVSSMAWIANNTDYEVQTPILALCIRSNHDKWYLRVFIFDEGTLRLLMVDKSKQN